MLRKRLFQNTGMLAMLSLAVLSCTKDEIWNGGRVADNVIGFGIATDAATGSNPGIRSVPADDQPLLLLEPSGTDTLYLHPEVAENTAGLSAPQAGTRGVPIDKNNFATQYKRFLVTAYTDDGNSAAPYMTDVPVELSGGNIWMPTDGTHYWPDMTLNFYAHAPETEQITNLVYSGNTIAFDYTVPRGTEGNKDAESQPDILFAHAACSKETTNENGAVSLSFAHALAGVRFVANDVAECTIHTITLKGLKGTGKCTYTPSAASAGSSSEGKPSGNFVWETSGEETAFCQSFEVGLDDQQTGEQDITERPETTFMMIPQSLEGVTIEISLTGADGKKYTLTGPLSKENLTQWEAGRIYTYTLSTESINWDYFFEVTPEITFELGETKRTYKVTSYRQRKGSTETQPVEWEAKNTLFSETNYMTQNPEEITYEEVVASFQYTGGTTDDGNEKDYTIEVVGTKMHTNWDNDEQTLRGEGIKGSAEKPYNLATDNGEDGDETTANCYVVHAAGWYKLPLVYGNALKGGTPNTSAYSGGNFKDYKDQNINSPYISNADDATLVWSDGFYMFKDIQLDAAKKYLTFRIDPDYLQQANAVLAVRDANDDIMWSWHIWVTERDISETHTVQDWFNTDNTFEMMSCNLGWVDGKNVYYNQRNLTYKFTQNGSGKTTDMQVTQAGQKFDYKDVGSTYYQWGRKDPLVAMKNWDAVKATDYRLHETGRPDYGYATQTGGISVGEAIQHPNIYYTRMKNSIDGSENWCSANITTLWNAADNGGQSESTTSTKTIYDPSPRGFKVPVPRAFAMFTKGTDGDGSKNNDGTMNTGTLNGYQEENGGKYNRYEVYPSGDGIGETIPMTATGQRADAAGLEVYTLSRPEESEIGGLWAMHGVYYWTCVPANATSAYAFVVRKDPDGENTANSYKMQGRKTMARPVRCIVDR